MWVFVCQNREHSNINRVCSIPCSILQIQLKLIFRFQLKTSFSISPAKLVGLLSYLQAVHTQTVRAHLRFNFSFFVDARAGVIFCTSTTPFASHHAQIVLWIQNCHFCTYSHSFFLCLLQWADFMSIFGGRKR